MALAVVEEDPEADQEADLEGAAEEHFLMGSWWCKKWPGRSPRRMRKKNIVGHIEITKQGATVRVTLWL
jgi:hypothetical protein